MNDIVKYSPEQLSRIPEGFAALNEFIIELTSEKVVFKIPAKTIALSIKTMRRFFKSVSMDLNFDRATGQFNVDYEVYHCYFYNKTLAQANEASRIS